MKLRAIKCRVCGDIIYSRAQHDYVSCSCGACGVDGGQRGECWRVGGKPENIIMVDLNLDVTLDELYDDWNTRANKYGRINEPDAKTD